jgi:hypothetical protein
VRQLLFKSDFRKLIVNLKRVRERPKGMAAPWIEYIACKRRG